MGSESDTFEGEPWLADILPRVVLRAPFVSKELGALRYISTNAEGVTVAMFDKGLSLHLHGDMRGLALALSRPSAR